MPAWQQLSRSIKGAEFVFRVQAVDKNWPDWAILDHSPALLIVACHMVSRESCGAFADQRFYAFLT